MLLKSVELENIKRYGKASFDFPEGIIAICGTNGAGKTTILEAIGFALFDWLPYSQADFIRRGEKNGTVRVTFLSQVDERVYTVVRSCQGQYYVYDPELKVKPVEQKADVQRWLRAHMGLAPTVDLPNLFVTALGVPQGTFTADFLKTPALRKKVFDPLLRVEEYKQAAEDLSDTVKVLQQERAEMDKDLAAAQARLAELGPTRERLQTLEAELGTTQTRAHELQAQVLQQQQLVAGLDEKAANLQSLQQRHAVEQERQLSLAAQLKGCQDQITQAQQAAEIVQQHQEDHLAYQAAQGALAELEPKLKAREEALQTFQRTEARFIEDAAKLEGLRQQLAELATAAAERQTLEPQLQAWIALEVEGTRLAETDQRRQQLKQAIEQAKRQQLGLTERQEKTTGELNALAPAIELAKTLEERQAALAALQTEIAGLQQLSASLAALEPQIKTIETQQAEAKARQTWLETEIKRLQLLAPLAETLAQKQQHLAEELSAVGAAKATVDSLKQWLGKIEGGVCPFLASKCLNLAEGQSLDTELARNIATAEEAVSEGTARITFLQTEVAEAQQAATALASIADLQRQLSELSALQAANAGRLQELQQQQAMWQQQLTGAEAATAKLQTAQAALSEAQQAAQTAAKADVLQSLLQDLQQQLALAQQEIGGHEESLMALGDLDALLAAHRAKVGATPDPRPQAHGLDARLAEAPTLQERVTKGEGVVAALTEKKQALEAQLKESEGLPTAIAVERERLAKHQAGHQKVLQHQVLAQALPTLQAEAERLTALGQEATLALADLGRQLTDLQSTYDLVTHQTAKDQLQQLIAEQAQITERLRNLQAQILEHRTRIEQLVDLQRQTEDQLMARAELDQIAEFLEVGRAALREAGPRLTQTYLVSISEEANRLYREITGQGWVELRWGEDYEIILNEDGHDRSFANLSGGEQMAASLAVRLALLKEISALDIAFFDEPTTNLDEERRRNLAKQLPQVKGFRQLVVISHDDTFEEVTDHLLRVDEEVDALVATP